MTFHSFADTLIGAIEKAVLNSRNGEDMNIQQNDDRLTRLPVVMFLAGICCFLWGSATPSIKTGYQLFQIQSSDAMSILLFAGIRFLLAGFLVILFHSIQEHHWVMPQPGSARAIAELSLTQTILQYYFFYTGLAHASGVHGAIITGGNVFISILVASLIFRYEKLTARKMIGCALGFAGIVIMNLSGQEGNLFKVSLLGEGFVLFAQVFYAFSSALLKKHGNKYDVVTLSGYQFMLGGLILILMGLAGGGRVHGGSNAAAYILLLYMAFISAVAYTLWGILLKYNPVSRVTVFGFMNPMFGVLLSALVLGETDQAFSFNSLVALILVCLGIYVVNSVKTFIKK